MADDGATPKKPEKLGDVIERSRRAVEATREDRAGFEPPSSEYGRVVEPRREAPAPERRRSFFDEEDSEDVCFVPVPYASWGELMGGGLRVGFTHVLAGPTGVGKTQLVMNLLLHAISEEHPVAYVGLQTPRPEVRARLLALLTRAGVWGELLQQSTRRRAAHAAEQTELGRMVDRLFHCACGPRRYDQLDTVLSDLRTRSERPALLVVDYLQEIGAPAPGPYERHRETREMISAVGREADKIARTKNAAVVLVSSIPRESYIRAGSKTGLQPSGEIDPGARAELLRVVKECGDVEFKVETMTVLVELPGGLAFACPKSRLRRPGWTGFRFDGAPGRFHPITCAYALSPGGARPVTVVSERRYRDV